MIGLRKFLNNDRSDMRQWQSNLFFLTTLFFVLLNIILYAALGSWSVFTDNEASGVDIQQGLYGPKSHWSDCLYFGSLFQVFFSAFSHSNWQHVLLNMLCFLICRIYLERKTGSVKLFAIVIAFAFFCGCAVAANNNSINFHGFSGVNYALYAYIAVDYLFCIVPRERRNKLNVISGGVVLALIYFAACFKGGTQTVGFTWYPYDALYNLGHYTSYFVGIVMSTVMCAFEYSAYKRARGSHS